MILDDIIVKTAVRLKERQMVTSAVEMAQAADARRRPPLSAQFVAALRATQPAVIAEVKQASPSKGQIVTDFPYSDIAQSYAAGGADAISVLTDADYFKGSLAIFDAVRAAVPTVPLLRKDFVIDRYMLDEARVHGADVVLLIVAILTDAQLQDYLARTEALGMVAIVEVHDATELARAESAGAAIIGINNRNLKTFVVDTQTTERLVSAMTQPCLVIAESGFGAPADFVALRQRVPAVQACLVGETLMRATDRAAGVAAFKA